MRLAIIPARGGSKGVPNKNLMTIAGRPLLGHAITCCHDAGCLTVVSTESPAIAQEARRHGAQVVTRPEELAGDESSSQDAMRHALQSYQADEVAFVQCTSPLLHAGDIRGCLDKLPEYDCVACCVEFDGLVIDAGGRPRNFRIGDSPRRQERAAQYLINGHCWAFRPSYLQWEWLSGSVGIHLAHYPHRLEIDTPADVELTEAVLENLFHRHRQHDMPDGWHGVRRCSAVA